MRGQARRARCLKSTRMARSCALRAPSDNAHAQWPAGSGLPTLSFPFAAGSDTPPRTVKSTGAKKSLLRAGRGTAAADLLSQAIESTVAAASSIDEIEVDHLELVGIDGEVAVNEDRAVRIAPANERHKRVENHRRALEAEVVRELDRGEIGRAHV